MMDQPILKTDRLLLRSFKSSDAQALYRLAENKNVAKTTLNVPHPYRIDMAESWIKTHKLGWETKTTIVYAITLISNEQLLGTIGLHDMDLLQAELGYWIGEPYWGNGYCTEAAIKLIQNAFEELKLKKIVSQHLSSNPASGEVMKKAGMRYVETFQNLDRYGNLADIEKYQITRK